MSDFRLHERLAADCETVRDLALCRLLLMRDARFPWGILVPRQPDVREIHELVEADRAQLLDEIASLSEGMQAAWGADKMNVAALGNMVPQLHIHVIARFEGDAAWPGPVWGAGTAEAYTEKRLEETVSRLSACVRRG